MRILGRIAVAMTATAVVGMSHALAAPVLWTLQDVTFADGATASGSFIFDSELPTNTPAYSSINITVTGGTVFADTTYTGYNATSIGSSIYASFTVGGDISQGALALDLIFASALTDAGGIVAILVPQFYSSQGVCMTTNGLLCLGALGPTNPIVSGFVTTEAVPLPAAAWLMAGGFAGLAAVRKRLKKH